MAVTKNEFGKSKEGKELTVFTLSNSHGMSVKVTDLGATLAAIMLPDKYDNIRDVLLGYDTAEGYYEGTCYFGALIGRSGNRIEKGRFELNGKTYQLDLNNNGNNLHSGNYGFDKRQWDVAEVTDSSVRFAILDEDMQDGYPGNFRCSVTYTLTEENELFLHYEAESDQDTVANMTNHAYFNLGGEDSGSVLDQEVMLTAEYYTPIRDLGSIPTGEIAPVKGTPMDFTVSKKIGKDIDADFEQLQFAGGYDHNFVLKREKGTVEKFAEAYCRQTGICLEAYTDLPGVQFYTGNYITPEPLGKRGRSYAERDAFCLETQFYPNSINQEGFARPVIRAGEKYESTTCYKFSVK